MKKYIYPLFVIYRRFEELRMKSCIQGFVLTCAITGCLFFSTEIPASDTATFSISPHHVGISVPNLEESVAWYENMFGFKVIARMSQDDYPKMTRAIMQRDDCYIEVFQVVGSKPIPEYRKDAAADVRVHGIKHFSFQVEDVYTAVESLKAKGANITMGPVESPRSTFAFISDNAGNNFEIIKYKQQFLESLQNQ